MAMITIKCPSCLSPLRVPDQHIGKRAACTVCKNIFLLQLEGAPQNVLGASGSASSQGAEILSLDEDPPPLPPAPEVSAVKVWALVASLISVAVICGSVGGSYWFYRSAKATPQDTLGRHACIAVESGGIRLIGVDLDKQGDNYEWNLLDREKENIEKLDSLTPEKLSSAIKTIKEYVEICTRSGVPSENISIVCNKNIGGAFPKDSDRDAFNKKIKTECGIAQVHITEEDETRFGALGTLPRSERKTSVFIDIGSRAKLGYYTSEMKFESTLLPGPRAYSESISKYQIKRPLSFPDAAKAIRWLEIEDKCEEKAKNQTAFTSRSNYHYIGGGAWVIATVMRPIQQARDPRVTLTIDDIKRFNDLVSQKDQTKGGVIQDALRRVPSGAEFDDVRIRVHELEENTTIKMEYLIAAGQILEAHSEVWSFPSKNVRFYTYGLHAWPLGYILVQNDLER